MDGGEDWLMRPIDAGLLPYTALDDPRFDLSDFVFVCEYLDVKSENSMRIAKWNKKAT